MKNIIKKTYNKFDLILIAAKRARQIQISEKEVFTQKHQKNKCTVVALQEIEESYILNNQLVDS